MDSERLLKRIVQVLEEHKGEDIVVLDLTELTYITDFFVICSGRSEIHVEALADDLELELKKDGILPWGVEGRRGGRWILLDYGGVVVHIFTSEARVYFDLERIWNQAKRLEL